MDSFHYSLPQGYSVVLAFVAVTMAAPLRGPRSIDANSPYPELLPASSAFLTPIGHKNNTLIMGPGGYSFGDYWRMGLPLEILIIAVGVPIILWVWPL